MSGDTHPEPLRNEIDSGLIKCVDPFGEGGFEYLPEDKIKALVSESSVQLALKESRVPLGNGLVDYILHEAKRTFLTLERIQQVHFITILQNEGFNDTHLPLGFTKCQRSVRPNGRIVGPLDENTGRLRREGWPEIIANWDFTLVESFINNQWSFLTPMFGEANIFYQHFDRSRQLPFTHVIRPGKASGQAGDVYKVTIHDAHTRFKPAIVALKQFKRTNYFDKELKMLKAIKELEHDHLINPLAAFDNHRLQCALFPWCDGGNLNDYWEAESSGPRDEELILWTLRQIAGLCDCLELLWSEHIRHGDLKPQNILYKGNRGNLVIADVGISKIHLEETKDRNNGTSTTSATRRHGAPEFFVDAESNHPLSRDFDTWSIGSVMYEWLYWLLYGSEGIRRLELQSQFWEKSDGKIKVAYTVRCSIKEMREKMNIASSDNALKDVLSLIEQRLLIIETSPEPSDQVRAKAPELSKRMAEIKTKAENDKVYRFSANIWDETGI